ncbi:tetratricopeptide repeat protein [Candidatus Poribacteria bacterium]|nr:tetratricopeptide repeat protein [Candidatus Poribacteria bacterium]
MALKAAELAKLEADFASGRNPLAYIPLCQALRRQRRYTEALEACQRGLRSDPNSVAGRTMLARLLADLGRYE